MTFPKAGAVLWMCCLQYFAGEAVSITGFQGAYSLRTNFISDLGAVGCAADFCSRLHQLMNASFLPQGCLILAGAILARSSFPKGWLWTSAIGVIGTSGFGVFVVGLAPEDVAPWPHYLGAAENFLFCNAGAALLGVALLRGSSHRLAGTLALVTGLIGLAGLACIAAHIDMGLGQGVIERVTAYPFPLWISWGRGCCSRRQCSRDGRSPPIAEMPEATKLTSDSVAGEHSRKFRPIGQAIALSLPDSASIRAD